MSAERLSSWIGIAVVFAGCVASYVTLREGLEVSRGNDVVHASAIAKIDDRQRAMERDSTLVTQITALNGEVAALKTQVQLLREELTRKRR